MPSDTLESLIQQWRARDSVGGNFNADFYRKLARQFIHRGECLMAFDVAEEGLKRFKRDLELRQLQGLALARSGASAKANEILESLRAKGHTDEETLGILASTFKDFALSASNLKVRREFLRKSHVAYLRAFRGKPEHYWTGINAATTALLLGDSKKAKSLAREVRRHCLRQLAADETDQGATPVRSPASAQDYWLWATLSEAALLLEEFAEAGRLYRQAFQAGRRNWGNIARTRGSAQIILSHQERKLSILDRWLPIPSVVVFAGHMIDRDRSRRRFPASMADQVKSAIKAELEKLNAGFGFASGACGSDILFLEAMLERGGDVTVVLPFAAEEFIRDTVDIAPGWGDRLRRILAKRPPIIASTQKLSLGSEAYHYTNLLLQGLATLRASQLGTTPCGLAVWDGKPGDGPAGTADVVKLWRNLNCPFCVVDMEELLRRHDRKATRQRTATASRPSVVSKAPNLVARDIKAMLFADVVKFSRIPEEQLPQFVDRFVRAVAGLCVASPHRPLKRNTWGDAFFMVFDTVEEAGLFALDLCDLVSRDEQRKKWRWIRAPRGLTLRIALHAGPVFTCPDPITGEINYLGAHVNRAARIEPITPPGQVYASQEFAALAALRPTAFVCDYAGQIPLPKDFGIFPTYHVRRK